jgi:uncharacterized protein (TIGR02246 family)
VGSILPVQSLLLFKSFVNHICSAPRLARPSSKEENIPVKVEVAYDCAANSSAVCSAFIFGAEGTLRFPSFLAAPVISLVLLMPACAAPAPGQSSAADADSAAIKKVCGDFSENFSRHDAHGVAMTFAEDSDFTNMGGRHSHGRGDIEKWFAALFAGNLKDSQRTDTVRSIRFFTPELAEADADTVITGTKTADGSAVPPRKGLMIVTMIKQNGRWFIGTFHEAEYPAPRGGAANAPASNPTN